MSWFTVYALSTPLIVLSLAGAAVAFARWQDGPKPIAQDRQATLPAAE